MRIAIVINTSWNIYNFRRGLINALKNDGHQLVLIAPFDDYSEKISIWGKYVPIRLDNTGSNPIRDLKLLIDLRSIYARERPDIILHFTIKPNIYGTLAARSLGIPSINNVSGLGTIFMNENVTAKIGRFLYWLAFRRGCHILFQNKDDRNDFMNRVNLKAPHSLIPGSGVDTKTFEYHEPPLNKVPRFLMVARLLLDKGVIEYLESARKLSEEGLKAEFVLAGELDEGHVRGVSEKIIDEYQKSGDIRYLGHVSPINTEMIMSDWIVLPSYREGTPRTLLEAAAIGRPLIATDVPGCREVGQDGSNAILCNAESVEALTSVIRHAIRKERYELIEMGKESRKLIETRFDERIVIEKYSKLIAQIIPPN